MTTPIVITETSNQIKRHNLDEHQGREAKRRNRRQATQADRVLVCICRNTGRLTRNEIAKQMNLPVSSVCGRVNTLISDGLVEAVGTTECPVTGSTVHAVTATADGYAEALVAAERVAYSDALKG